MRASLWEDGELTISRDFAPALHENEHTDMGLFAQYGLSQKQRDKTRFQLRYSDSCSYTTAQN